MDGTVEARGGVWREMCLVVTGAQGKFAASPMRPSTAAMKQNVLPALICFAVAFGLAQTPFLRRVENLTLDERTKLRASYQSAVPSDALALVAIDQSSLSGFGKWPWPRDLHGDFLQLVGLRKPSAVAWDILFDDPSELDGPFAKGALLADVPVILGANASTVADSGMKPDSEAVRATRLAALPNVTGDRTRLIGGEAMRLPVGSLGAVTEIGFVDTPPDIDGVRRAAPLVVQIGGEVYPSLSLRSLMAYWRAEPKDVSVTIGREIVIDTPLAKRRIPIDERGRYWINFRHRDTDLATYGYDQVVSLLHTRYVKKEPGPIPALTGRILLIGQTADGLTDMGPTPFSPLTPLVLVHANVIDNVLNNDFARRVPRGWVWLGALAVGIGCLFWLTERKLALQVAVALGLPAAFLFAATVVWIGDSRDVPVVGPVLGFGSLQFFMIARRVLQEQRAKEQIKGMFGSYLSPALVTKMVDAGEMPRLGGHEVDLTAYFSDIQGFSTFSEILPPDRLVELMNEYLTACTDIVQEEGGTLDKYIGDAIVAMYGAPVALPDHAYRACVSTLRVQQRLGELREKWKSEGAKWPEIVWRMQSRIGLNSGRATVGNMGSRSRFNYTMMGDAVNLAARMESGAKQWGAYIMCAEATKLACEKHGGDRVVFRPLGRIVVKGRSTAVPIFEIVGFKDSLSAEARECVGLFSAGLDRYYRRDWAGAKALFEQSSRIEPNQPGRTPGVSGNPSLVYLEIVDNYAISPPPEEWDGVYVMKEK